MAAVLHDAVEDTNLELRDLVEAGYQTDVVTAVDSLTRRVSEPYEDYIERVVENEVARRVKVADLRENRRTTSDCAGGARQRGAN